MAANAMMRIHEVKTGAEPVPMITGLAHTVASAVEGLRGQGAQHRQSRNRRKSYQKFSHFRAPGVMAQIDRQIL
jgi:hypothetical protein